MTSPEEADYSAQTRDWTVRAMTLLRWMSVGVLALVIPLVVAAETSFKSIIEEWFNTCSVAIDQDIVEPGSDGTSPFISVELFVLGNAPEKAKFILISNSNIFASLKYRHDDSDNNRAFHPKVGEVTRLKQNEQPGNRIDMDISPFSSKYFFRFIADITPENARKIKNNEIAVGSFLDLSDNKKGICRIYKYTYLDALVGASSWGRFWALAVFIGVLTVAVNILRGRTQ